MPIWEVIYNNNKNIRECYYRGHIQQNENSIYTNLEVGNYSNIKENTGNAPVGSTYSNIFKVLDMLMYKAFRVTQFRHWKCL